MYLRLILPVIALHGLVLTHDVGIIEQDSLILIESWGSGEETSETTTASPTTTAAYTTMEIVTPEVTTTQEPKFNTSEIVIISMFSLFGFLFLFFGSHNLNKDILHRLLPIFLSILMQFLDIFLFFQHVTIASLD